MSEHSQGRLLGTLLSMDDPEDVHASPSFESWAPSTARDVADGAGGLWLLDTRDPSARARLLELAGPNRRPSFDAALILCGAATPAAAVRRLFRRIRGIDTRFGASRVAAVLAKLLDVEVRALGFDDGTWVPFVFDFDTAGKSGVAYLVTKSQFDDQGIWRHLRNRFGSALSISSLQLRARGAGIATVEAGSGCYVIRVTPPGDMQEVVARNHELLSTLRFQLRDRPDLLQLVPEPVFADQFGSSQVLAETLMPGRTAWPYASTGLEPAIYNAAVWFLEQLSAATIQVVPAGAGNVVPLLAADRQTIESSDFASPQVKELVRAELDNAQKVLTEVDLTCYASHGDYGYGNLLIDPTSGTLSAVIDWDTARTIDFPGVDRINLEIQRLHGATPRVPFPEAVMRVWRDGSARDALAGEGGCARERALFGLAVTRYVTRTLRYAAIYERLEARFERALLWMADAARY